MNSGVQDPPRLLFLGDIWSIPNGWPLANVFSIGDVIIAIGVFVWTLASGASGLAPHWGEQLGGGLLARFDLAPAEDHVRPHLRQPEREIAADPTAASRDDGDVSGQIEEFACVHL